jgi:hypothetical protein
VAALDAQYGSSSSNGDTGIEGARRDASISTRDAQYYASRDTSWASTLNSSTSLGTSPWIVKERTSANAQAAYSTSRATAQAAHDTALLSAIDNWQTSNRASTLALLLAEGQSGEAYNKATASVYANWEMGVGNLLGDKPAGTDWKTGGTIADGVKTTGASGETNNHRLFERGFSETPGNSQRSGQVKNEDIPSLPATTTIAVAPKSEPFTESEPEEVYVQDWWGQQYKVNNNYFAIGVGVFGARVIWWWSITPDRNRHYAPTSPGSGYSSDSISQIIRSSALDDAQKELNRKTWMEMEANAKTNEQVVRGFRAMQTFGKEQAAFEAEVLINGYAEFCASATGIAQSCSHGIIGLPGIRRGGDAAETAANSADNLPLGKLADDAPNSIEMKPYGGPGGGHHTPPKKAFEGAPGYDKNKALAIPNNVMESLGIRHPRVTGEQAKLYNAFAKTGKSLTWEVIEEIETKALIAGGADAGQALATVRKAIQALKDAGVAGPTRIPWGG